MRAIWIHAEHFSVLQNNLCFLSHNGQILKTALVNAVLSNRWHATVWTDRLLLVRSHINVYSITNNFMLDIIQMLIQQFDKFFHFFPCFLAMIHYL